MLDTELEALPRLIADAAEPLPDIDDPAFGAIVRPLRRRARRAARRGEPRHERILSRPRGDLAPADRAARLQHRRGRGRLARRGDDRPLRPPSAVARGRAARVRALPDLDVAQPRGRRLHPLAAPATTQDRAYERCAASTASTSTTLGLDAGGDRLPRARRIPSSRGWRTAATAASSRGPRSPQLYGRHALLEGYARCEVGVVADAEGPAAEADRLLRARVRRMARRGGQRAAREGCRGLLSRHVPRLGGELEFARHAHVRDAEHDPRRQGAARRRRSSGRTTATSATPPSPTWACAATS